MKILYVLTIGGTSSFFVNFIRELIDLGHEVDIACSAPDKVKPCYREWGCKIYELSCSRNPLNKGNRKAVNEIKKIVSENGYDMVHCHTPVASMCTRYACRKMRKRGLKVFYTAHGFHFYKGAPIKNWLLFYPLEFICSRWTDAIITINHEDYNLARTKLKASQVYYIPGMGVDLDKFRNADCDKSALRSEIGVPDDAFMLLSVGEVNDNKNHRVVMKACELLGNSDIHYVIAGDGDKEDEINDFISTLKFKDNIHLLGRREDIPQLCKAADCFVFPSKREGLGLALIEGIASGLPAIGSDTRGINEILDRKRRFKSNDEKEIAKMINDIYSSSELRQEMINENAESIKKFSIINVNKIMKEIYFGK